MEVSIPTWTTEIEKFNDSISITLNEFKETKVHDISVISNVELLPELNKNHGCEKVTFDVPAIESEDFQNIFSTRNENELQSQSKIGTDVLLENERNSQEESFKSETRTLDFQYKWRVQPKLLCSATDEYKPSENCENYTKGCQWSPDGTCLLVPSEDFRIRIYDLPKELYSEKPSTNLESSELKPALNIKEGGLIYDSCWYPYMNSWNPVTCCFLSTSQETPIHLWDAFTKELRATYRAYNQVDEVEPAISLRFINAGTEVWGGFKNVLRKFDTERPGRQIEDIFLKHDFPNIPGLVSCIRENPIMPGLVAFGTYSKCIGLYQNGPVCCFKTSSGVTQIEFSPCGTKLYSAVRRNNEFLCWDLRNPGVVLWSLENRQANTNQRIHFEVSKDGSTVVSGGTDGFVKIWETDAIQETEEEAEELIPISRIQLSTDCINGVSLHASLPLLATSSGQRICDEEEKYRDNSVKLWWFSNSESQ